MEEWFIPSLKKRLSFAAIWILKGAKHPKNNKERRTVLRSITETDNDGLLSFAATRFDLQFRDIVITARSKNEKLTLKVLDSYVLFDTKVGFNGRGILIKRTSKQDRLSLVMMAASIAIRFDNIEILKLLFRRFPKLEDKDCTSSLVQDFINTGKRLYNDSVLSTCDCLQFLLAMQGKRNLFNIVRLAITYCDLNTVKLIMTPEIMIKTLGTIISQILELGDLEKVEWYHKTCRDMNISSFHFPDLMTYAVRGGNVNCIKYLESFRFRVSQENLEPAARYGRLECVKYIISKGFRPDEYTIAGAIRSCNVDLVKYLHELNPVWPNFWDYNKFYDWIERKDSFKMVKYLFENGFQFDNHCYMNAGIRGNIKLLNYLYKNVPYQGEKILHYVLRDDNPISFKTFKWFHKHGFEWNDETLLDLITSGKLKFIKYMVKHGYDMSDVDEFVYVACEDDQLFEVLRWFVDKGTEFDIDEAIKAAMEVPELTKKTVNYLNWIKKNLG